MAQAPAGKRKQENEPKPLAALSLADKRFRGLAGRYLFRNVSLSFYGNDPWTQALKKLDTAGGLKAAGSCVRSCHIHLQVGYKENDEAYQAELPGKLADLLAPFTQLERIVFVINEKQAFRFATALADRKLRFPHVKEIVVGPYCDFIVGHCPNVETISTNSWVWLHSTQGAQTREHSFKLIRAAGNSKNLKRFEMNEWWSIDLLTAVYDAMPTIPYLILDGGNCSDGFFELLPTLGQFQSLKTLGLVNAASLGVGFDPPWCGNAYMGPGGAELAKSVHEEGRQASQRVADATFATVKGLQTLWLGDHEYFSVNAETGVVEKGDGEREKVSPRF